MFKKILFLLALFLSLSVGSLEAQHAPSRIKVARTNRPNWIRISNQKLVKFYRNFNDSVQFKNMKLVKSDLSYYLIADVEGDPRIFAFELDQKGKRLFLNKFNPVQSCTEGKLSLDSFIQKEGKIQGCRLGSHKIMQKEKG